MIVFLYAFEPDGKLRYKVECENNIHACPVYSKSENAIYFGNCDGVLRRVELSSGKITGQIDLESPIPSSPVMHEDILYVLSNENGMAAIRTKPFSVLYRSKLSGSYMSAPYIEGNTIYLTDLKGKITAHSCKNGKAVIYSRIKGEDDSSCCGERKSFLCGFDAGKAL